MDTFFLGHFTRGDVTSPLIQTWLRPEFEEEADCFATTRLAGSDSKAIDGIIQALTRLNRPAHPPYLADSERVELIRRCLAEAGGEQRPALAVAEEPKLFDKNETDKDAIEDLHVEIDTDYVQWNTDGRPPVVDIHIGLRNAGSRPVLCELILQCGTVPHGTRADFSEWYLYDAEQLTIQIESGATEPVRARLRWPKARPLHTMPALRWVPLDLKKGWNEGFVRCTYKHPAGVSNLPTSFVENFRRILAARDEQFRSIRGIKVDGEEATWDATISLGGDTGLITSAHDDEPTEFFGTIIDSSDGEVLKFYAAEAAKAVQALTGGAFDEKESLHQEKGFYYFRERGTETSVIEVHYSLPKRNKRGELERGSVDLSIYAPK